MRDGSTCPGGGIGRHKGLKSPPDRHLGRHYDAVTGVFVPYVTV